MGNLMASLYTANTGLGAAGTAVGVIGNNLANVNTTGFKASRAHFQDLISQFIVGTTGTNQVGKGVSLERIEHLFTQGAMQHTGVPTDLAIGGDGFFIVKGTQGGVTQNFYSRNGAFRFDDQGYMVNQSGYRVQGYSADPTGVVGATLGDLQINKRNLDPLPTSNLEIHANLRPSDPIVPAPGFDVNNPDTTSSFKTSMVVYDSLGNSHQVDVYGTHSSTAPDVWDMNMVIDGADLAGGVAGTPQVVGLGQLTFDGQGRLQQSTTPNPVAVAWSGGANAGALNFNWGDPIAAGGTGRQGSTQWNQVAESAANFVHQDGYGTGNLETISVNEDGLITGGFTNGQTLALGQVALARFEDPTGLNSVGGNRFIETPKSGQANIGVAQTAGRGLIAGGTLEQSNVEISDQFIDLIAYQKAYQANAKTISTADGLMQEVFQILR
jgi:flagellar hook protein FlgE